MIDPISLPAAAVALVLALPLVYVLNGFTPWSKRLWADADRRAYVPFWTAIGAIHWVTAGVAVAVLWTNDVALADLALGLDRSPLAASALAVAALAVAGYVAVVGRADAVPAAAFDMPRHGAVPGTTRDRACYLATAIVTAPLCEEFLYRAVAIPALLGLGLPAVAAVPIASVAFVFVHGVAPLRKPVLFGVYFAMGVGFSVVFVLAESLLVVVALHAATNALSAILSTRAIADAHGDDAPSDDRSRREAESTDG